MLGKFAVPYCVYKAAKASKKELDALGFIMPGAEERRAQSIVGRNLIGCAPGGGYVKDILDWAESH